MSDANELQEITRTGLGSRLAREMAMQIVFVIDVEGRPREGLAEAVTSDAAATFSAEHGTGGDAQRRLHDARRRAAAAARSVYGQWTQITQQLERLAPQWPPHRMPATDRAILRLATWELLNTPAPPKAIIDEAIELAKRFGTGDSYRFVNGVLDAVLKERESLLGTTTSA